jgi:copper chaperone CopZ
MKKIFGLMPIAVLAAVIVGCAQPAAEPAANTETNAPTNETSMNNMQQGEATLVGNKATLKVDGMSCGSCEGKVKEIMAGKDGVKSCVPNVTNGTMEVVYDPSKTSAEKLAADLSKEADGHYKATVVNQG